MIFAKKIHEQSNIINITGSKFTENFHICVAFCFSWLKDALGLGGITKTTTKKSNGEQPPETGNV